MKILLIIGGGIAAYKSLLLIRLLKKNGHSVKTILTKAGAEFVTPLSISSLTGEKTYTELFSLTDEVEMGHIELSRSADMVLVAPATADLMAKMANGLCNDLASTALLATNKPIYFAPAMNVKMWEHPATKRNVLQLQKDGATLIPPTQGEMACGEFGFGRMAEPEEIYAALTAQKPLTGKHIVITAGPTREAIDPVRFISNHSSGKQGYALAKVALEMGACVTLISGPVALTPQQGAKLIKVETAVEMLAASKAALPCDIFIAAAAVADWRILNPALHKQKKKGEVPILEFTENPDILKTICGLPNRPARVIGFAAETQNLIENAKAKLQRKGCDMIVANDVSPHTGTFGGESNIISLVTKKGIETMPNMSKEEAARKILGAIV
jgi:phosphopantothenoylcysteine decarboxylase / phosphopantothenate---cysteine ligase